jgi:hypothetical protein
MDWLFETMDMRVGKDEMANNPPGRIHGRRRFLRADGARPARQNSFCEYGREKIPSPSA